MPVIAPNPQPSLLAGHSSRLAPLVSDQVAQKHNGRTLGVGNCQAQTRHISSRLGTIAEAPGATMPDAVKITAFR